ncbi:MAG: response regulator transcription factor [Defluviitaleaceae bacterium]|nr:response regulator transcription factor [Defluviitaleaceae bacterium]
MVHNGTILLVEDDKDLNNANRRALELKRYAVHTALTLAEAREHLITLQPDIILLDVNLPDGDGFSFCDEIRGTTAAHIIFLTAKTGHEDILQGLSGGGDDYISKPFHMAELLARVESAMRRRRIAVPMETLTRGGLTLDLLANRVFINGEEIEALPQKAFDVLFLLVQNEGKFMSAEYIYEKVWARPMGEDSSALQIAISRLRKGLAPFGYDIRMVRNKGYVFTHTDSTFS